MKRVIITVVLMLAFFSISFVIAEKLGYMDPKFIAQKTESLQSSTGGQVTVAGVIIGLLVVDILLPVPSSIVMALSGKLLGFVTGGTVTFVGAMLAAWIGFYGCRWGGEKVFVKMVGDEDIGKVKAWFERYGVLAIIISRPVPMLTEILSCLAGLSKVSSRSFTIAAILGTLPICFVYSYVGSRGELTDPWPAVWISIIIPALGWLFARWIKRDSAEPAVAEASDE